MATLDRAAVPVEVIAIRREAWRYACDKPGRVAPADSPNRPALARLWQAGYRASQKRKRLRSFKHSGWRFGVIYLHSALWVFDWETRSMLVKAPRSLEALAAILNNPRVQR